MIFAAGVVVGALLALGSAYLYSWLMSGAAYRLWDRLRGKDDDS